MKKSKWLLLALGTLAVVAIGSLAACTSTPQAGAATVESPAIVSNQQTGIWVTGQGKVSAAPDVCVLQIGVQTQAPTVSEAQSQASKAMDGVMNALTSNGVAKKDIQTVQFTITRLTRWDDKNQQPITTGYQVTNMVRAKVRTLDKVGTIIDAAATAGGDATQVNSIAFTIDDPTALMAQARDKAMTDAKAKADQVAKASGVTLGKPTYISESSYQPVPVPLRAGFDSASGAAAPETAISPGETDITVTVSVAYSIQ